MATECMYVSTNNSMVKNDAMIAPAEHFLFNYKTYINLANLLFPPILQLLLSDHSVFMHCPNQLCPPSAPPSPPPSDTRFFRFLEEENDVIETMSFFLHASGPVLSF